MILCPVIGCEILLDCTQWTQREGSLKVMGPLVLMSCFELGDKTLNDGLAFISHRCPPVSPFPLIFPWRSIKRQPFERLHWFLGISGDKMCVSAHSSFNYPIWSPLIWQSHAGSVNRSVNQKREASLLKTHIDRRGTDHAKEVSPYGFQALLLLRER